MTTQNEDLRPPITRPTTLDFGTLPPDGNFTREEQISNPNEQRLLWCVDKGETKWLTLTPSAGSLEPGEQQIVNVTADTNSLEAGDHQATLNFSWEGDDYSVRNRVPVTLGIARVSPLAVGLSFSLFQNSSNTLPLAITNRFDQTVNWIADTGGASWLTLDRSKGILKPREQQTIYVSANSSHLRIRDYAATLTFTPTAEDIKLEEMEDNRSKSVYLPVELHVFAIPFSDSGPKIPLLNPNSFNFVEHTTSSLPLSITNQEGRGRVQWTIDAGGVNWVTLTPSSGIFQNVGDNVTVNVRINRDTLIPNTSTKLILTLTFIDSPLSSLEPTSVLIPVTISV